MLNRYPLWKYILLIIIVVCGMMYAIPNLFGEDPAIEVGGSDITRLDLATLSLVKETLSQNKIAYLAIDLKAQNSENSKVIVRLSKLDDQLKSKDLIQAALGPHYTSTINLVPATPSWLVALGAQPMKLGLDLRGGVHFLLQVDLSSIAQSHLQSDVRVFANLLQKEKVHYSGLSIQQSNLVLKFKDDKTLAAAQQLLSSQLPDYSYTSSTLGGDFLLKAEMSPTALKTLRDYTLSQTIQVLNNRINSLGVAESVVTRQGLDRISVDLPGVQDTTQARQILGGNATLEMRLVDETADLQSAAQGIVPIGSSLFHMIDGSLIVLKNQIVLTGDAITNATASFDQSGRAAVDIRASGSQINEFHRITGENVGKRMAMVLVDVKNTAENMNGKIIHTAQKVATVISAPVINSALPGSFQITGLGSQQTAKNLAIQLRSGTTPANLYPLQELLVGPSLGKANIQYGLISVVVGFLAIVVFMICYYRLMGLIANLALGLNLILIVALMSIIGFTLSLPGMAAMVLTVGMAVDANVLIFERIREELRQGIAPQAAIQAGYERAFSTIVDSNVTTLIVAIILFMIATSAIKAFAITLIIGLLTSMLTAIMGTRAVVNLVYGGRNIKKLSIGI
jgi:preprotein translocase subunit SecD